MHFLFDVLIRYMPRLLHRNKQTKPRKGNTMRVAMHRVETITYETKVFENFSNVTLTITDKDGVEMEVRLFADDLKKLNFVNQGIELVDG